MPLARDREIYIYREREQRDIERERESEIECREFFFLRECKEKEEAVIPRGRSEEPRTPSMELLMAARSQQGLETKALWAKQK